MALTSLNSVKTWLNITVPNDDIVLTRLINQISGATLSYLGRPTLFRQTYTELRDGVGNQRMVLRNWPVLSVSSLVVGAQTIPAAATMTAAGYTLATWDGTSAGLPQEITLRGYEFCRGRSNVQIIYTAGYAVQNEPKTIPSGAPYTLSANVPSGSWAQDDGVSYTNGTALTAVTGSPSTGQYSVAPDGFGNAVYTFAAGDAGQAILISYSYIPADLEQAVVEWISERYKYKDRIGQTSRSLGGNETAAYSLKGIPDYVSVVLDGYKKFLPL